MKILLSLMVFVDNWVTKPQIITMPSKDKKPNTKETSYNDCQDSSRARLPLVITYMNGSLAMRR